MQTFLPYPNFELSAKVLDYKRLGKQRVEAMQIFNIYVYEREGRKIIAWKNHPVIYMWRGYEFALLDYLECMINEWIRRGYKNTIDIKMLRKFAKGSKKLPWWIGNVQFHLSHQSNLVRKFPEYYKKYFSNVPDNIPYYWPRR